MSEEEPRGQEAQQQQQPEQEQDPNSLTEEDKKVYAEIMGSINRMDKKLKNVKGKVPTPEESAQDEKRNSVNLIAEKLIEAKENSDIIMKEDLVSDVQQTFEQMVVTVYTENQQMKQKINSLIAIIKDQNKKINEHKLSEEKLRQENEQLRSELMEIKDSGLVMEHHQNSQAKKGVVSPSSVNTNNKNVVRNKTNHDNEDYDFWSMPNNESSVKKRKNFVADSGLWVNDKDIDKSVFITDQRKK